MSSPLATPVLDVIFSRRATRAFAPTPVTDAQVHVLLQAAVHAPTSRHVEPWAFAVVQDRALLHAISERARELAIANEHAEHVQLGPAGPLADPAFDAFHGAGTLIVICSRWHGRFSEIDCWLAAENLMLAATALGLATCPIAFALPALSEPAVRADLGLPAGVTVVAPIVVGVAAGEAPAQSRRPPEILTWRR